VIGWPGVPVSGEAVLEQQVLTEPVVGVDIGPDCIRATQIERVGDEYYLSNIGIIPTPPGSIDRGFIVEPKQVAQALKQLFRDRRFDTNRVATAIRGRGVVGRIITLPSMPQDRLKNLIENEVGRYVMFSDQDKVVYYYPLEEFDEFDRRKVNILLVVAQKSLCRTYFQVFKNAGLDLVGIDFSTFAILRELKNSGRDVTTGNTMALVLDSQGACLNIFRRDRLQFLRHIRMEDNESITNGFKEKVVTEVMLSLHYQQAQNAGMGSINRLVASLGTRESEEIGDELKECIDEIPVETHSPFSNIKVNLDDFPPEVMEKVDTNFLTSVGIALRGQEIDLLPFQIDLLPTEIHQMKAFGSHVKTFAVMFFFVLFGFILAWQYIGISNKKLDGQIEQMELQIKQNKPILQRISAQKRMLQTIDTIDGDVELTRDWLVVLEEVKSLIPKNVQLRDLDISSDGSIEFSGIAEAKPAIFYFVSSLKNSPMFSNVQLVGPRNPVSVYDNTMVTFVIRSEFRFPSD